MKNIEICKKDFEYNYNFWHALWLNHEITTAHIALITNPEKLRNILHDLDRAQNEASLHKKLNIAFLITALFLLSQIANMWWYIQYQRMFSKELLDTVVSVNSTNGSSNNTISTYEDKIKTLEREKTKLTNQVNNLKRYFNTNAASTRNTRETINNIMSLFSGKTNLQQGLMIFDNGDTITITSPMIHQVIPILHKNGYTVRFTSPDTVQIL